MAVSVPSPFLPCDRCPASTALGTSERKASASQEPKQKLLVGVVDIKDWARCSPRAHRSRDPGSSCSALRASKGPEPALRERERRPTSPASGLSSRHLGPQPSGPAAAFRPPGGQKITASALRAAGSSDPGRTGSPRLGDGPRPSRAHRKPGSWARE